MTTANPFTEVLKEAQRQIRLLESAIVEEYGAPLFVEDVKSLEWPDKSPDDLSPEEVQHLISLHGEDAFAAWINEYFITKMQQDAVDAEKEA